MRYVLASCFLIAAIIVSFQGLWGGYLAGDDNNAFALMDMARGSHESTIAWYTRIVTEPLGGLRIHWAPLSNVFIKRFLHDDRLFPVVVNNLALLFVLGVGVYGVSTWLGASVTAAILAAVWCVTRQGLVFSMGSCWGGMNVLEPIGTMFASIALFIYVSDHWAHEPSRRKRSLSLIFFLILSLLSIVAKETGVRLVVISFIAAGCLAFMGGKNQATQSFFFLVGGLCLVWGGYFLLRYYGTESVVPFIREGSMYKESYQTFHPDPGLWIRNGILLLLGVGLSVNSYGLFLFYQSKEFVPIACAGMSVLFFGGVLSLQVWQGIRTGDQKSRLKLIFLFLLIVQSLFPEVVLGKVSEMYLPSVVWPIALLIGVLPGAGKLSLRGEKMYYLFIMIMICSSMFASREKVAELIAVGKSAHAIREDMREFSRDLPPGATVGLLFHRRGSGFGRFGLRGVDANAGLRTAGQKYREKQVSEKDSRAAEVCALIVGEKTDKSGLYVVTKNTEIPRGD